jgi:acetyl-CoA carboxylase carboxyltransferase component
VSGLQHDGWQATLDDLERRRDASLAMGGTDRLARHGAGGKLDARARIDALLDPGSFRELGMLAGGEIAADAIVTGAGLIEGRPVMVGAEDFTTVAGTIGAASNSKRYRIAELALLQKIPLIMLLEGAGFRPSDHGRGRSPVDLIMQARCSGQVPIVCGVLGPSAGHGALVAPMADFCVMTEAGSIFTAGPPVVKQPTGEDISKELLGGPSVAVASGLVHNVAASDEQALAMIRRYLSFFPSSAWSYPAARGSDGSDGADTGERLTPELLDLVPREGRKVYDMRRVIDVIVDRGDWFDVQPTFGRAIICALAQLGGEPVAIVANQPRVMAGSIDSDAADKAAHFISVADAFHLPLVFLADNPGVLPGSRSERAGILRSGARMFAAQSMASTPKVHLTLRKAYGFGSMVMSLAGFDGQVASFAYPGSTLGAMGAGAQSSAMGASADLAESLRAAELAASYNSAESLGFDELLDPRDTRNALLGAVKRGLYARQAAAQPVLRSAVLP